MILFIGPNSRKFNNLKHCYPFHKDNTKYAILERQITHQLPQPAFSEKSPPIWPIQMSQRPYVYAYQNLPDTERKRGKMLTLSITWISSLCACTMLYVNVGTNLYQVHSSSNKRQMARAERIKHFLIQIQPYLYTRKLIQVT